MRFLASLGMTLGFYVLATLASLYTHYYDTFILVALNVFVFAFALSGRRWKTLARWIAAQAVLVAAYAPWVVWGTNRVTTYGEASAEQSVSLLDQFSRTLATFVVGETVSGSLKAMVWLPLALALVVILIYLARQDRSRAAFLLLYIAVPTLALYVLSIGRPLFLERYLNGIAPAYYLAFAVGLAALSNLQFAIRDDSTLLSSFGFAQDRFSSEREISFHSERDFSSQKPLLEMTNWAVAAIRNSQSLIRSPLFAMSAFFFVATSAYSLANYYFDPAYVKSPNWRALAQFIAARQQPGDIVIQNFTEMAVIYYQRETLPVLTLPKDYYGTPADDKTLQRLNKDYRRIWFIPAQPDWWDPGHSAEKYLTRFDEREIDTRVAEFGLQLYLTPREFSPKIMPVGARIANATLVGYRVPGYENKALRFSKGATFTLVLYWRAEDRIEKDFSIFVHLIDASGRVVAQHDGVPAEGVYPTSQWRADDSVVDLHELQVDAAPGTYSLVAGMYDPATMVRVPIADRAEDFVQLTQVVVQ